MSLAQELRTKAKQIAAASVVDPVAEAALQRRLGDALAGDPSFLDATLLAYVAMAAAGGNGDGAGSAYNAWYSSVAAKLHDLATDAVAAGR